MTLQRPVRLDTWTSFQGMCVEHIYVLTVIFACCCEGYGARAVGGVSCHLQLGGSPSLALGAGTRVAVCRHFRPTLFGSRAIRETFRACTESQFRALGVISAAIFSGIMIVGALVFPVGMVGMIEASTTRKPSVPAGSKGAPVTCMHRRGGATWGVSMLNWSRSLLTLIL
jgi:hypothetical protein